MVWVVNTPQPSIQVWFDGNVPTRLNWAGCQVITLQVHRYIHLMQLFLLSDYSILSIFVIQYPVISISRMKIGPEAIHKPPKHYGSPHPCFEVPLRCSQPPLELWNVLPDSARAFAGASEGTCSNGGAFRIQRDMTIRIVRFSSCWVLCVGLRETSRAAKTSAQALRETWRRILTAVVPRVPKPPGIWCIIFVCYSHKIRYIMIWHVISTSLYIHA